MGKLNVPPVADPDSNVRKGAAHGGATAAVGKESGAAMEAAFEGKPGPGAGRNAGGGGNMSFNSGAIHAALK